MSPNLTNLEGHPHRAATRTESHRIRSRFQREPRAGLRLQERDEQLLCDLFLHRAMARGQIQRLYFGASVGICNARLRLLFDYQYLSRYYLPTAPFGAQAIYSIGKAAVPLVSARLAMDAAEVSKHYRRSKTPMFLEHTLAIVDLWITFREATEARAEAAIETWLPELLCRHEYEIRSSPGGAWKKTVFKPDAFVRLMCPDASYRTFFIEVDLGHTSSQQFKAKLQSYQQYRESGLFQERYGGEQFQTLVVTTGERRLKHLRALVEAEQDSLFWFSTFDLVEEAGMLGAIWQVPLASDPRALV